MNQMLHVRYVRVLCRHHVRRVASLPQHDGNFRGCSCVGRTRITHSIRGNPIRDFTLLNHSWQLKISRCFQQCNSFTTSYHHFWRHFQKIKEAPSTTSIMSGEDSFLFTSESVGEGHPGTVHTESDLNSLTEFRSLAGLKVAIYINILS